MSVATASPDPFRASWRSRIGWIALAAYVVYACAQMDLSWDRVGSGMHNAAHFFSRLFPPNFSRWDLLVKGLQESLEIAVLASALGIIVSLPVGLCASRNRGTTWHHTGLGCAGSGLSVSFGGGGRTCSQQQRAQSRRIVPAVRKRSGVMGFEGL